MYIEGQLYLTEKLANLIFKPFTIHVVIFALDHKIQSGASDFKIARLYRYIYFMESVHEGSLRLEDNVKRRRKLWDEREGRRI